MRVASNSLPQSRRACERRDAKLAAAIQPQGARTARLDQRVGIGKRILEGSRLSDVARQFANVFAAIFQIYASYTVGSAVGAIAQEYRSLILPATFAFAIWGPIFILCGFYALHQALPAQRENPVYRAIGWWTVGAFLMNGAWSYAYTSRQFLLAQAIIFAGFVFAGGSYLRFARVAPAARATPIDNWLIGPTLGLLFGWITAANVVGLAGTLIAQDFVAIGQGAEIRDAALLLLGGAVACLRHSRVPERTVRRLGVLLRGSTLGSRRP